MNLLVIGANGMLGRALLEECANKGIEAIPYREKIYNSSDAKRAVEGGADAIINAAGCIPAYGKEEPDFEEMVTANALLPGWVAKEALEKGIPFLHVSTDCVFSGFQPGSRRISDIPEPTDTYGITKRLGEDLAFKHRALIVRTSFIGLQHGLLRWLLDQPEGSAIPGYINAYWSGSFVNEVARILIIGFSGKSAGYGVRHLSTPRSYSKHEVLRSLVDGLGLNLTVTPTDEPVIYRGLVPSVHLSSVRGVMGEIIRKVQSSSR